MTNISTNNRDAAKAHFRAANASALASFDAAVRETHDATVADLEARLAPYALEGQSTVDMGHPDGEATVIWLGDHEKSYGIVVNTYGDGREQEVKLVDYELGDCTSRWGFFLDRAVSSQLLWLAQVEESLLAPVA